MAEPPTPLNYASRERPRVSRFVLACLGLSVVEPLAAWGALGILDHDQVCPSCGGWGAALAIALAGATLLASGGALLQAIRGGTRALTVVLGCLALALSALFLLAAIGLYFAIQA